MGCAPGRVPEERSTFDGNHSTSTATGHPAYGALDARLARRALAAVLAGEALPEPWMEEITAPGEDDEDEQRTYTRILTANGDCRRRHHRAGPDILGPRPAGLDADPWPGTPGQP